MIFYASQLKLVLGKKCRLFVSVYIYLAKKLVSSLAKRLALNLGQIQSLKLWGTMRGKHMPIVPYLKTSTSGTLLFTRFGISLTNEYTGLVPDMNIFVKSSTILLS